MAGTGGDGILGFPETPHYNRDMTDSPLSSHPLRLPLPPQTTSEWQAADIAHVWHPFTPMSEYAGDANPVIVAGEGFELIDTDGRRYLDGVSNLWCNVHGHRVPELDAALRAQVDRIAHSTLLGIGNTESIALARELVAVAPPGLDHVFYSDDGSTAVEAALKMAFQYHLQRSDRPSRRPLYLAFEGAYHGDTVGAVSVGGIGRFHATYEPLLFRCLRLPAPAFGAVPQGTASHDWFAHCRRELELTLRSHHREIAAVVVEPLVQMAGGILVHEEGFLSRLRQLTCELDIPLIADEVAVAFGRLGSLFACDLEQVVPDFLCLSKGLTGGYLPLAATLVSTPVYESFLGRPEEGRTFYHGHTFTGNPLGCAVARASLRRIETHAVLDNAARLARRLEEHAQRFRLHPHVAEVRVRGLVAGVDLVRDQSAGMGFDPALRVGHRVVLAARKRGVMIRPLGDVIEIIPAPAMPVELLDRVVEAVEAAIEEVLGTLRGGGLAF